MCATELGIPEAKPRMGALRPKSRESVTLYNSDPLAPPKTDLNTLSHPDDIRDLKLGAGKAREILMATAFEDFFGVEVFPGEGCQTDETLDELLHRKAEHVYHPIGTCKMGVNTMAVVDPQLRIHGLKCLCPADGSIMPSLINDNTNAPIIMIAEKAFDMVLFA